MRLIDVDALKKRVSELIVPDWTRILIGSWVDAAPTVDAVPVVRCKDCKHHEVFKNGVNGWCNGHGAPTDVTYFCADGERRTDEQQT